MTVGLHEPLGVKTNTVREMTSPRTAHGLPNDLFIDAEPLAQFLQYLDGIRQQ